MTLEITHDASLIVSVLRITLVLTLTAYNSIAVPPTCKPRPKEITGIIRLFMPFQSKAIIDVVLRWPEVPKLLWHLLDLALGDVVITRTRVLSIFWTKDDVSSNLVKQRKKGNAAAQRLWFETLIYCSDTWAVRRYSLQQSQQHARKRPKFIAIIQRNHCDICVKMSSSLRCRIDRISIYCSIGSTEPFLFEACLLVPWIL